MNSTRYYVAATVDGFIADRDGGLGWLFAFNDAEGVKAHYERFLGDIGAIVMGADTYDFVQKEDPAHWPYKGIPTWVFTHRTLPAYEGADIRFTEGDLATVHREMVAAAGEKGVWLVGGGKLAAQFVEKGLVDELWLTVCPVVLGAGIPLLPLVIDGPMQLLDVTRFGQGLVELRYALPRRS